MVLDTPSPLIVVPSRLIDPFVGIRTVHSYYLPALRTGNTTECRQLTGNSLFSHILLYGFRRVFIAVFGSFCSISYDILSSPGAEFFLLSLIARRASCRSNGSFNAYFRRYELCFQKVLFDFSRYLFS